MKACHDLLVCWTRSCHMYQGWRFQPSLPYHNPNINNQLFSIESYHFFYWFLFKVGLHTLESLVCSGLTKAKLKQAQVALQNPTTWTKKFAKDLQEWKNVYICVSLLTKILKAHVKTHFASQVIISWKTLQYMDFISICYGWQA
jgi:hypothetical protein